jgi:hypothetical protein
MNLYKCFIIDFAAHKIIKTDHVEALNRISARHMINSRNAKLLHLPQLYKAVIFKCAKEK